MRVIVNLKDHDVPSGCKLSDAVALLNAKPPYAVAVNLNFIPKTKYAEHQLHENDQIEIIAPVTGG